MNSSPIQDPAGTPARDRARFRTSGLLSDPERAIRFILHVLVAAVPLAYSDFSWLPFVDAPLTYDQYETFKVFIFYSLTLLAAGVWAYSALRRGIRVRYAGVEWLILAFLVWALAATILSIQPGTSFLGRYTRYDGWATYVAYAAIFFLALQSVITAEHRRSLARTIGATGCAVALYGVMQYLGLDPIPHGALPFEANQAFSTLGNPNLLGGYLIFPLTLSAALALTETQIRWRAAYWAFGLTIAAAWLTTFTRGAWIGGGAALVLVAFAFFRSSLRLMRIDTAFASLGVAATSLLIWSSSRSGNSVTNILERASSIVRFDQGSARQRSQIWQGAVDSIRDSPIFGHGPDTFRLVFKRFGPRDYVTDGGWSQVADNSHNYPLQVASGAGIPGALLLYGAFAYSLFITARSAFSREHPPQSVLLAGFWAASFGYIIHLMLGISVIASSTLLWISLAALLGTRVRTVRLPAPSWGRPAAIAALIVALLGIGLASLVPIADHYYLQANIGATAESRLEGAQRAIRLNPLMVAYRAQPGHINMDVVNSWLIQANAEAAAGADPSTSVVAALVAAKQAMRDYEDAIAFAPTESENHLNLAIAANQAGQIDPTYYRVALDAVEKGLEIDPHNPGMRVEAARAHLGLGQTEQAIRLSEEAASIDPRFPRPHKLLGDIYASLGRREEALAAYQTALSLNPTDPIIRQAIEQAIEQLSSQSEGAS